MTRTFKTCLVLCSLLLLQRVEAQSAQTERPQTVEQQKPVEDPLGRSTPHGTAVGLIRAAEQENLDRAAEYLESALKPPDRRELARKLGVVLDRKLLTSLDRLSREPGGDPDDGLTNRDRIGLVESPSGNVEIFLDRVQRGQSDPIWLFSSSTLQEIPRLYDEIQPPWIEGYVPEPLRTTRWLAIPLYRWIALLLVVPLVFGLASLFTRALSVWLSPWLGRLSPEQDDHKLVSAGPLRLLVLSACFYVGSFFGLSLSTRHFWQRVAETLMVHGVVLAVVTSGGRRRRVEPQAPATSPSIWRRGAGALDQPPVEGGERDRGVSASPLSGGCRSHRRAHRVGRRWHRHWLRRAENDREPVRRHHGDFGQARERRGLCARWASSLARSKTSAFVRRVSGRWIERWCPFPMVYWRR